MFLIYLISLTKTLKRNLCFNKGLVHCCNSTGSLLGMAMRSWTLLLKNKSHYSHPNMPTMGGRSWKWPRYVHDIPISRWNHLSNFDSDTSEACDLLWVIRYGRSPIITVKPVRIPGLNSFPHRLSHRALGPPCKQDNKTAGGEVPCGRGPTCPNQRPSWINQTQTTQELVQQRLASPCSV